MRDCGPQELTVVANRDSKMAARFTRTSCVNIFMSAMGGKRRSIAIDLSAAKADAMTDVAPKEASMGEYGLREASAFCFDWPLS